MPFPQIIYEDEAILVLEKPSGITVNRADTTRHEETIQEWVEQKFPISNFQFQIDKESDFYKRSGIVHRLDKETSGILLVAKTEKAFSALQKQFKDRTVKKTYLALVHGALVPEVGEVQVPVGRLPWSRKRFGVIAGGRDSVTKYKVLKTIRFGKGMHAERLSLVELFPETGRTHQIRVHMKHLNHPVFADELYGGRKTARDDRKILPRLFLHAHKISFQHPTTGKEVTFTSELPDELQRMVKD